MKKALILLLLALMVASNILSGTALAASEKKFVLMDSPTTKNLRGIWGFSANDVYAVGEKGTILHYDGSNWTEMTSNTTATLEAIWGTSNTNLYAVGTSISEEVGPNKYTGQILHYNGTKWSTVKTIPATDFYGVWGMGNYVYVCGIERGHNRGIIYRKEGSDWKQEYITDYLGKFSDVWGYQPEGSTHRFLYLANAIDDPYYGPEGELIEYSPIGLTDPAKDLIFNVPMLQGVWGSFPQSSIFFAVGGNPKERGVLCIYDYKTKSLKRSYIPKKPNEAFNGFTDVWGVSDTDVYAVGYSAITGVGNKGIIYHYDGTSWTNMDVSEYFTGKFFFLAMLDIWGVSSDDFFAVGDSGIIFQLNTSPNKPTNKSPANSASDVSLTPRLQSSAFSDPNSGNTHAASQWQITTTSGDYSTTVYDSDTDTENKVSLIVPGGTLVPDIVYYWRVRHQDNYNTWSDWSNETSFTPTLEGSLPKPGLTPDNSIYFLKTWRERVTLFFTFDAEKKAKKALDFAELKLAEIKAMADKNKSQALKKAQQQYEKYMQVVNNNVQKAKEEGKNVDQLTKLINEQTAKNQQILNNILGTQPELVGDTDGDGVTDDVDQCVNQAGPIANNGCPYLDTDGDGVFDDIDVCVTEAGPASNNGCPLIDCDDGDRCTIDSYDATTASCIHNPVNCDDGDLCTIDKCFPEYGCGHANIICDDNNPCTNDMCDKGQCINTAKDCNDDDARTIDSCDTATGLCKHTFSDTDGDGLKDDVDQCINQAGPASNNGCPYPDTDGDGVTDDVDNCDTLAGPASNNGCPEDDDDGDGVVDSMDPCPNEYGPIINDGCPYGDYDGDGLTDDIDQCLTEPGPVENNGCPLP